LPDEGDAAGLGLVAGRFRVLGLLGSGATASVYEALDTVGGGRVAVKVLHPHLARRAALREAFLREARTVAGVQHPSLCGVIGSGVQDEAGAAQTWTAWEVAPGLTLSEHVRERGVLPARAAVEVAVRVLDGLAALHAAGLVHRDISPSNIVIDVDAAGRVRDARVIDFGLVDAAGATTRGGDVLRSSDGGGDEGVVGNLQYAAPELLRGEGVDVPADLYQLAGVLYFALAGEPPFPRESAEATIRAHQSAAPPTASVRVAGVPVGLDRLIVRAMLKDPGVRFASAGQMRAALVSAVAPPTGAVGPATDRTTRTRVLGAAPLVAEPPPESPERSPGQTGAPWLWGLGLVVAALAVAIVIALSTGGPTGGGVETPSPVAATPTPTPTPSAPASSSPPPPAPSQIAVPPLEGLTADAARRALEEAGLAVGEVRATDSPQAAGTVLGSEPSGGALAERGAVVALTVASGSNAVPEVSGDSEQAAVDALASAGFSPSLAREPSAAATGTVIAVQPGPGTSLPLGSPVVLVIASPLEAPAPTQPPITPTPTPTPTPTATPGP
jgi:serine/threonine-protein kinase